MLLCQQQSVIDNNNENEEEEKNNSAMFLTSAELSAYMTPGINIQTEKLLIIDCGSPLRYNERRIKESFLLNINDKLSRKRLINRGLQNFLDQNQLNRLNQSEIIILYNDTIQSSSCSKSINQCQISPVLQCIFDEIKRYDSNKRIHILQSSFEEFYQHYPTFCFISSSNDNHNDYHPLPSPTVDIDSYEMSEVLPGLYLGNAHDAQDMNLLKQNQIKFIINISTTIPCYHENENLFEYLRLSCNDNCQENILQYFEKTFEYIHQNLLLNQNVLVHCQGGISRSPSFIIGYLMKYYSKTFDQAYTIVKDKRKIINPNLNFLAQLTRYEQMITSNMQ
jgi:dual specificity MAP kinase phosphatase